MKVSMKDLHLSCSEDMGPLYNLNILPFQNNMEELVRSFHSLPIPPYNYNVYIIGGFCSNYAKIVKVICIKTVCFGRGLVMNT